MSKDNAVTSFLEAIRVRDLAEVEIGETAISKIKTNVGEFARRISAILRVSEKSQVQGIIEEANRWRIPLYPYSGGCNWGYGSALPANDGGVLLDLSRLNRIIRINEEQGTATIEPGVTQRQLAEELARRSSQYYLDVTGSGADTSVLGNALERGVAYGSIRVQQLSGIEVLLGNGTQFRTGFGDFANPLLAGLYPYGLGPSLDALFFQSNFGIVLEGELQLTLRPEGLFAITISLKADKLTKFVDKIINLVRRGYFSGIPHLADRERTISTMAPLLRDRTGGSISDARDMVNRVIKGDWTLTAAVTGPPSLACKKIQRIKKDLRALGRSYIHEFNHASWRHWIQSWLLAAFASWEQKLVIAASEQLRELHQGKPSDAGIRFLLGEGSVDESVEGFLLCTPLAPLAGKNAEIFSLVAHKQAEKHRVRIAMTLNVITSRVLEAVISVHFLRTSQEEKQRAHLCVQEMTEEFASIGFYPYRINIDQQKRFLKYSPSLAKVTRSLKETLDPNGIIAPGRYSH